MEKVQRTPPERAEQKVGFYKLSRVVNYTRASLVYRMRNPASEGKNKKKNYLRASKMAEQAALAAEHAVLSSIPGTHNVEGQN